MNILITGGAGYIGSHTCIELIKAGHNPIIVDDLSNSCIESIKRVEKIAKKKIIFYKFNLNEEIKLEKIFLKYQIDSVIHFAGSKSLSESIISPIEYYINNVSATLILCRVMKKFSCNKIIFSSSAAVYGEPSSLPIMESFPLKTNNPYGHSKLVIEKIFKDIFDSEKSWNIVILRYFNPVGAHESGLIGENPIGLPANLVPYISLVAKKQIDKLRIFGGDYNTHDGTGIRDYIHVVDLAKGHIKALFLLNKAPVYQAINLSTGAGYSVLDIVKAFEHASGQKIPYEIISKRKGDVAASFGDSSLAKELIDWQAEFNLERMCIDTWRWVSNNPYGYNSS